MLPSSAVAFLSARRKTLGKYELAVVQTTAVDTPNSIVNLTTMLAHSSGEWISSDWPVCQLAAIAAPHRMGAALTYARRYALFALVGIAGEDDLDAPDLHITLDATHGLATDLGGRLVSGGPLYGSNADIASSPRGFREQKTNCPPTILKPEQSAASRDQLLAQITELSTADEAAFWRQFVQVLYSLDQAKYHRIVASRGRFTPHQPQW